MGTNQGLVKQLRPYQQWKQSRHDVTWYVSERACVSACLYAARIKHSFKTRHIMTRLGQRHSSILSAYPQRAETSKENLLIDKVVICMCLVARWRMQIMGDTTQMMTVQDPIQRTRHSGG